MSTEKGPNMQTNDTISITLEFSKSDFLRHLSREARTDPNLVERFNSPKFLKLLNREIKDVIDYWKEESMPDSSDELLAFLFPSDFE